jgi:hypothetical protein
MRRLILASLVNVAVVGCASNRPSAEPGARIRDTTLTAKVDTTHANDTLPHIRDTVPDSTRPQGSASAG